MSAGFTRRVLFAALVVALALFLWVVRDAVLLAFRALPTVDDSRLRGHMEVQRDALVAAGAQRYVWDHLRHTRSNRIERAWIYRR